MAPISALAPARVRVPLVVVIGATANAATAIWVAVAVYVSGRGLGAPDEAFYLLAYRRWAENPRTFTGAQYLYGPLFDLLGNDIGLLRLCRLALVLGVHLVFAVAFVRWLRFERPAAVPDGATAYCCGSLLLATGAIVYGWLPATPGYNDVTAFGSLVLLAVLLNLLRTVGRGQRVSWASAFAYGAIVAVMVLARPPVSISLAVMLAGTVYGLKLAGSRDVSRFLLGTVGGVAAFALVVQVSIAPWGAIAPPMREQLGVLAANSHPPLEILRWYLATTLAVVGDGLILCAPLVVSTLLARRRSRWTESARTAIGLLGFLACVTLAIAVGGFQGGEPNALAYSSTVFAMLVIALTAAAPVWRTLTSSGRVVAGGLLVVPALQAVGTNLVFYSIAINGAAAWVALMLLVRAREGMQSNLARVLPSAAAVVAVAVAVAVGVDGLSHDAGGRPLVTGRVRHAIGVPELSSVVLPESQARSLGAFRADLGDLVVPDRPMLAFGDLAQYILVLGGRPIGESWFSAEDDGLDRADLLAACRDGNPWGSLQPLVVANRAPSDRELAAWRSCGVEFSTDYVDVTPPSAPHGVRVFAPSENIEPARD